MPAIDPIEAVAVFSGAVFQDGALREDAREGLATLAAMDTLADAPLAVVVIAERKQDAASLQTQGLEHDDIVLWPVVADRSGVKTRYPKRLIWIEASENMPGVAVQGAQLAWWDLPLHIAGRIHSTRTGSLLFERRCGAWRSSRRPSCVKTEARSKFRGTEWGAAGPPSGFGGVNLAA